MTTPEDVAFFRRNGYLLPSEPLLPEDRLQQLTRLFEEHLADRGSKLSDELDTPHFHDPRLLEFLLADDILDVVEPLTGPDILLWSSHFISKEPGVGRATPWHTDSDYWDGRLSDDSRIVTVWLSLDGSDTENGCMRVIPGSHMDREAPNYVPVPSETNTFGREMQDVEESAAVDFVLRRGQASLHDGRIVHGANPNTSTRRRTGYTMRYLPANVRLIPERNHGHLVWLARGRDGAGNTYQNA
ncbi:MAG TPA: phytanoyl-CoA dioxygenase family protein [Mycobacteriales bacterium]|nr:phytanoyl-CoA dioxygenase family protein [Mycobacteriales bacterium]